MDQIATLRDCFVHRSDTYAVQRHLAQTNQWVYWRVTQGRCPQQPPCPRSTCPHIVSVPLTDETLAAHLRGDITVGVYQIGENNTVKWMCLDVDIDKNAEINDPEELWVRVREHTRMLARTFQHYRLPFLVEFSGNRGFHLWSFFAEPVPAAEARRYGLWIVKHVEVPDGIHVEVFPKQVATTSFGSLVKLPLGIHQKTRRRCVFLGPGFKEINQPWEALRTIRRLSAADLRDILATHATDVVDPATTPTTTAAFGLPCLQTMMEEGVAAGLRDEATFLLACYLRAFGVAPDLACAALTAWNHKNAPPLDVETVERKVASAYSQSYSYFPCRKPHFDKYCVESCRFYERKARERGILR